MTNKAPAMGAAAIAVALFLIAGVFKPLAASPDSAELTTQLPLIVLCTTLYLGSFVLTTWANRRLVTILCGGFATLSVLLLCAAHPFLLPLCVPSIAAWFILVNRTEKRNAL